MKVLQNYWKALSNTGLDLDNTLDSTQKRSVVIVNQLSVVGAVAMCVAMFVMGYKGPSPSVPLVALMILLFLIVNNLNRLGWFMGGKLMLTLAIPTAVLISSIIAKRNHPELMSWENYVLIQFVLLGLAAVPPMVFSCKECFGMWSILVFHACMLTGFYEIHNVFGVGIEITGMSMKYPILLSVAAFVGFLFVVSAVYFMQSQVMKSERQNQQLFQSLAKSEQQFRAIFENAAIGVALVDKDSRAIQVNPRLEEILGYSSEELTQMTFPVFTHIEDIEIDVNLYRELLAGGRKSYEIEKRYIKSDGSIVWGKLSVSLIYDEGGLPKYAIGMVQDITESKVVQTT